MPRYRCIEFSLVFGVDKLVKGIYNNKVVENLRKLRRCGGMADTLDSKSSNESCAGSSPAIGRNEPRMDSVDTESIRGFFRCF